MAAPQTTTPKRETHQERVAKMRREHAAKVAAVKSDHRKRLQEHQQVVTESASEIELQRELAAELDRIKAECDDDYTIQSRRGWRRHRAMLGLPLDEKQREDEAIEEVEGNKLHANDPRLRNALGSRWTWQNEECAWHAHGNEGEQTHVYEGDSKRVRRWRHDYRRARRSGRA
jgi:hypothetical protein